MSVYIRGIRHRKNVGILPTRVFGPLRGFTGPVFEAVRGGNRGNFCIGCDALTGRAFLATVPSCPKRRSLLSTIGLKSSCLTPPGRQPSTLCAFAVWGGLRTTAGGSEPWSESALALSALCSISALSSDIVLE